MAHRATYKFPANWVQPIERNDALHCIEWIEEFKKSMYNIKEDRDKEMNNKEKILLFEGYITWAIFFRCSFVFFPKNTHTR